MSLFSQSLFKDYFRAVEATESARICHRWAAISTIASLLGDKVYINFGGTKVYPNFYIMIVGSAGSRKSTAIKYAAKLLKEAKYVNLAAAATSREQFFEDFASMVDQDTRDSYLAGLLDPPDLEKISTNYTVIADEFNDFAGLNNIGMYTSLANLWDYTGVFEYRPKHGKKVAIINPLLNILAGNTADGFAAAFPANVLNQGLVSRTLVINSGKIRQKLYWPETPDPSLIKNLVGKLVQVSKLEGEIIITAGAKSILKDIYENWHNIEDSRFASYGSRRYRQLLKLCIVIAASYGGVLVTKEYVIEANTILTFAERHMPDALGEHGLSKSSPVVGRILDTVKNHPSALIQVDEIYKAVATDVRDLKECKDIIMNLVAADRLQATRAGMTYVHKKPKPGGNESLHCNMKTLWENEQQYGTI
jgi:hypothetical protein